MGGECNYLLRVEGPGARLQFVPDAKWKSPFMTAWSEAECQALLDDAEALLLEGAHRLRLPVQVIRKERACGVVPTAPTIYEVLEELAITVQVGAGREAGGGGGRVAGRQGGRGGSGRQLACMGCAARVETACPWRRVLCACCLACTASATRLPSAATPSPLFTAPGHGAGRLTPPRAAPPARPQSQLQSDLPFCAFNGGNDVFVDVGNKSLGLEALMNHLGLHPAEVRRRRRQCMLGGVGTSARLRAGWPGEASGL